MNIKFLGCLVFGGPAIIAFGFSGLLKNMEQNKLLLNLENFTSHCLKNPEILLVLLIGPLLIRTYCVYNEGFLTKF